MLASFMCSLATGPSQQRENNWFYPPYEYAGQGLQALQHPKVCQALGTIILPNWELVPRAYASVALFFAYVLAFHLAMLQTSSTSCLIFETAFSALRT
jgi:hypothetical protein